MLMDRMCTRTVAEPEKRLLPWPNPIGIGLALTAMGCANVRYVETFVPEGSVERVVVRSDAGSVELTPADQLRVERAIRAPEGSLQLSHAVDDGVLVLEARCRALLPCAVDVHVSVPEGIPVDVDLGSGEVWATGLREPLTVRVGDGTADMDVTGSLVATVGSGDVRASLPSDAVAHIAVGDGNIAVVVPPGRYDVDASAARVELRGVESDPGAPGRLELVAPAGSATVTGAGQVASLR
jgi:hypothetical protein